MSRYHSLGGPDGLLVRLTILDVETIVELAARDVTDALDRDYSEDERQHRAAVMDLLERLQAEIADQHGARIW